MFFPKSNHVLLSDADPIWYKAFLKALAQCGTLKQAAEAAGVGRWVVNDRLSRDPAFALAAKDAIEDFADELERKVDIRAFEGVDRVRTTARGEPILDPRDPEGKTILIDKQYSDALALARLRALRPEKYRDREQAPVESNVQVNVVMNNPQALEALKALRDAIVPSKPPPKEVQAKVVEPSPNSPPDSNGQP
jgi:hypothetical protein